LQQSDQAITDAGTSCGTQKADAFSCTGHDDQPTSSDGNGPSLPGTHRAPRNRPLQ
jgi:hypothetical protein